MTNKVPCPECGELNYPTLPACWKCGAAMKPRPAPEPPKAPETVVAPEAPAPPVPPSPAPEVTAPEAQPSALSPQPFLKPAEREAAALHDKEYVTPPVDVEDTPKTPGELLAFAWAGVASAGPAFRQALDDYNRRRGRSSGGVSSYGCVLAIIVITILIMLLVPVVSFVAGPKGR
jgi:hypothetical protein